GLGLLTNEGDSWLQQRRLAQPAFHRQRLAGLTETITSAAGTMLERWRRRDDGGSVDIAAEMTGLTMEIVSRALLGSDLGSIGPEISKAVHTGQEHVNWRITHLFSLSERWPTPRNLKFNRALKVLDGVVYGLIEQRRRSFDDGNSAGKERTPPAGSDLLSLLLEARDEET